MNDPETTVVATVVEASPATAIKPADIAKTAESAGDFALAGTRCWWAHVWVYGKNILGMRLWTYNQRIDWCAKGTRITSHSRKRWGTTSMPGWSWEGNIQSSQSGGVGSSYYESWTQGHFCLAKYFSCVQNQYPVIDMTVRYNGTYSY